MSYGEIVTRTWNENILFSALLELTYSCNLDCHFCYNDKGLQGELLSEQQYFDLLEELAEMQVLHLVLSGGEPLAHPAFFSIGARARELGFLIRLKSNGHALNERLARRIKSEINPFAIDVSLHGASPETHDRQTRVPGSYQALLKNLRIMQDLGLRLGLNVVLTAWNEHELEAMFEVGDCLDIPVQMDSIVTPRDDGDNTPLQISPSIEAIDKMVEVLARRDSKRFRQHTDSVKPEVCTTCDGDATLSQGKHCGAGSATLAVNPYGSVYPCVGWRRRIGSLHENSLAEIWRQSSGLKSIRNLAENIPARLFELGDFTPHLGFCPGQAELETGSPLELYPSVKKKEAAIKRLLDDGGSDEEN